MAMAMAFVLAIVVTFLVAHLRPTSGLPHGTRRPV
ncbi:putative membrane protein [Burkholderia mallei]|nr:putative membrane protein [Burkholderia mallei]